MQNLPEMTRMNNFPRFLFQYRIAGNHGIQTRNVPFLRSNVASKTCNAACLRSNVPYKICNVPPRTWKFASLRSNVPYKTSNVPYNTCNVPCLRWGGVPLGVGGGTPEGGVKIAEMNMKTRITVRLWLFMIIKMMSIPNSFF